MTFNLRCDTPRDGENQWPHRKEAVVDLIRRRRPDVAGLQEALPHQLAYLRENLHEYGFLGEGRNGGGQGEHTPVVYRRDRFRVVASHTFWLSETPDVPGSMSWETACTRIATWAVLAPAGGGAEPAGWPEILVVNTHLDHRSQPARERGAALVMRFIDETAGARPVIVTGDFNGEPGNPAVREFLDGGHRVRLRDTLAVHLGLGPGEGGPGTFHGFRGIEGAASRIDYVLASADLAVRHAQVVTDSPAGRPVSDHFPVEADLAFDVHAGPRGAG